VVILNCKYAAGSRNITRKVDSTTKCACAVHGLEDGEKVEKELKERPGRVVVCCQMAAGRAGSGKAGDAGWKGEHECVRVCGV
jgi:hypothetical protein